ncbi:MAG TPA: cobyrinate a,c-diamide synthase [Pirellulales bacterium]|jgi:cobyrinic acid a,c-diamide synthase|nr:cobyrinate a,c-diamide synthase [Pirellulales bacterium]
MARLVVAGTHSGAGKTTVTLGLMAALARRGLRVQPYKVGPDYIDPTWHTAVTGVPSRNLDLWLLSKPTVKRLASRPADISIIEGVMGLFDGPGSTAELARFLKAPVVLVVDGHGMAGSAAAVVRGFEMLERGVQVAGVILNRISSAGHFDLLREAIEQRCRARVLGYLGKDDRLRLPERHLGLVPAQESGRIATLADNLVSHMERTVDLEAVLALARERGNDEALSSWKEPSPRRTIARIAVARDEAFCFYYEDNLDLLRAYGAELVFFSPLVDRHLPEGVGGVYFGGGFPELFEKQLRASPLADELTHLPVYAECGGLMFLSMIGLIPGQVTMTDRLQHFGYCEAEGENSFLIKEGEKVRGHEFHYSTWDGEGRSPAMVVRRRRTGSERREGYAAGSIHASYVHVHFHGCPWLARRFVRAAAKARPVARVRGKGDKELATAGGDPP